MIVSQKLNELSDVDEVSVMMGTPANKSLLNTIGFWHDVFNEATPNDICVSIKIQHNDQSIIDKVTSALEQALEDITKGQKMVATSIGALKNIHEIIEGKSGTLIYKANKP